jgi:hypothetical protein
MEIAEKARNTGKYSFLRFIPNVETVGRPLPVVPEPKPAKAAPVPEDGTNKSKE